MTKDEFKVTIAHLSDRLLVNMIGELADHVGDMTTATWQPDVSEKTRAALEEDIKACKKVLEVLCEERKSRQ